jgi:hypothetical protein
MDDWGFEEQSHVNRGSGKYRRAKVLTVVALGLVFIVLGTMLVSFFVYKSKTISLEEYKQQQMVQGGTAKEDLADNSKVESKVNEIETKLETNRNSTERFGTVADGESFAMLGKMAVMNYKVVEKDINIGLLYDDELIYVGYTDKLPLEVLEKYGVNENDDNYEVRDFKGKHYFVKKKVEFVDV